MTAPASNESPNESLQIAGVVLAAGSSVRMGENKLLLALDGEAVVRRAARAAVEAGLAPVIVVLGHEADRVRRELDGLPCDVVVNPAYAEGKGTSLQVGIAAARGAVGPGAAIVSLADMPFVSAKMLAAIAARRRASATAKMVISRYGDVNAPPMLYDRALFDELLALSGEACGKEMVRRHGATAEIVAWPEAALTDIDVPEDYARVRASLQAGEPAGTTTGSRDGARDGERGGG